jgi:methylenetetrahydrofolate reductase (NADH)
MVIVIAKGCTAHDNSEGPTMKSNTAAVVADLSHILREPSLEMTAKDIPGLLEATGSIPGKTRVNVTYLGNEDLSTRVAASKAVSENGFTPVPHISARRIQSTRELEEFLAALQAAGASDNVFAVAGDPNTPMGPYKDALALIQSGTLQRLGVRHVSISGYPEGHPRISDKELWLALEQKIGALNEAGLGATVLTQFLFDADAAVSWVEAVRSRGFDTPIRIGVPGPAGVKRLLNYAKRFGISSSAGIARKYGLSLTNLMGTAGPDRFINDLAAKLDPLVHGQVQLHFYTFGGLAATADWVRDFALKPGTR